MRTFFEKILGGRFGQKNTKTFGRWLFFLCIIVFVGLAMRFTVIAVGKNIKNVNLSKRSQQLYTQTQTVKAKRGDIYDAKGTPIAQDTSTYSIYAVLNKQQVDTNNKPLYVVNKKKTAKTLAKYLPISEKKALKILNPKKGNPFQVEFGSAGNSISLMTKKKIDAEKLPGIHFTQQQSRLYPNGSFASNVVGVALSQNNEKTGSTNLVGQMGLEQQYNNLLKGSDGYRDNQYDLYGYRLTQRKPKEKKVKNGANVYTTIDSRLQTLLESSMSSVYKQANPKSMSATLMNAKTGEILATTQRPTFNSTTLNGIDNAWSNKLVQDTYEPGSTMKIFTLASAIDSGHYNGKDTYQSGKYSIDGKIVPDWNTKGWGTITYNKGFALSSNVAMAHLEQNMGAKTWKKYINKFHFLDNTNSGLPGETDGKIQFTYPIEQADTSFGQGIEVTAMQMLQGLTAVSNDGTMVQPHVVSKVVDPNTGKTIKSYGTKTVGKPISAKTAKKVRKHMEDVVYKKYGIGSDYKIKGYKIAAKTGTAQVSNGYGGYANGDDSYLYSVAGMAPAKDPKYVLYITMKQPTLPATKTATQLLSEIFKPVMTRALQDSNTASTVEKEKMPSVVYKTTDDAKSALASKGITTTVIGQGSTIIKQSIKAGTKVDDKQRAIILTNDNLTMPRIYGWTKDEIEALAKITGLKVTYKGSGYADAQSITAGKTITDGDKLTVDLE